jgi:hypothetical protein
VNVPSPHDSGILDLLKEWGGWLLGSALGIAAMRKNGDERITTIVRAEMNSNSVLTSDIAELRADVKALIATIEDMRVAIEVLKIKAEGRRELVSVVPAPLAAVARLPVGE